MSILNGAFWPASTKPLIDRPLTSHPSPLVHLKRSSSPNANPTPFAFQVVSAPLVLNLPKVACALRLPAESSSWTLTLPPESAPLLVAVVM